MRLLNAGNPSRYDHWSWSSREEKDWAGLSKIAGVTSREQSSSRHSNEVYIVKPHVVRRIIVLSFLFSN